MVSPGGVAPSRMVSVSASVNLPCTIKSRSSLLALAHPGSPGKRAVKRLCVCVCNIILYCYYYYLCHFKMPVLLGCINETPLVDRWY